MTEEMKPLEEGKELPLDASSEMVAAALKVDWSNEDEEATVHNVWHAMLAAMPHKSAHADLVERIEAAICKAEGWDREHYDANPGAKAAAIIAQSEYERGWKDAQEAICALPTPTAPSISKKIE